MKEEDNMCIGNAIGKSKGKGLPFQEDNSSVNAREREALAEDQYEEESANKDAQYELRKASSKRRGRSSLLSGSAGGRGFATQKKSGKTTLGV